MKKYKIGYTTGVFDLFHVGHLNILEKAKEQCDYLIVGVSTDELVQNYKHKTPVIPFEQRIKIVEAIKYVDKVVPQVSLDKVIAYEKYKFNAIFHGDDWKNSDLYNKMEKELSNPELDITHMTELMHISRTKFYYKVKGLTGENPSIFFKTYKLNRAAELILEGIYTISEIADMTGFSTLSHFSKSFKKQFGVSPSEYKTK